MAHLNDRLLAVEHIQEQIFTVIVSPPSHTTSQLLFSKDRLTQSTNRIRLKGVDETPPTHDPLQASGQHWGVPWKTALAAKGKSVLNKFSES